ncbi:MAG TPA: ABC transporter substrate-binding protein [Candidatus Avilachnospira avistercoris]|nr:ABC transporter substrate-binding protein [Candidatus Avilachnospira avistercoris]
MKKRFLALGLTAAMSLSLLAGCSSSGTETTAAADTEAAAETEAAESGETEAAAEAGEGSVYYLNFKPEQDAQWQELASIYTEETGVPVTVVTAASGTYETMLTSEMASSDAPTLFQVNGPVGLNNWKDYCYDLSGSAIYGELTSDDYALSEDGTVYGIAYVIESYGLIVNQTLLSEAGYTVDDIQSFDNLKAVAEDITARQDELGFAAFTSAGMDSSSDWRFKTHLANLPIYFEYQDKGISSTDAIEGTYLDNYRNIWDLYINNSTCSPAELTAKTANDSLNEFVNGEAVFYQNGSWEYANVVGEGKFSDEDVTMIPIYIGVGDEANQGLCTGSENYWCVNKNASEEDIQATLDFMEWCVTDETALAAMTGGEGAMPSGGAGMAFAIPFSKAPESSNLFVAEDAALTAAGKTPVSWNFTTMPSEEWKNMVGSALAVYAADQTDENWASVVSAFVDNWAAEYALANG